MGEVHADGRALLKGKVEHAPRDAAVLLAHTLGKNTDYVYLHPEVTVPEESERQYFELIRRRADGEPLAYLRGYQEFMGLRFRVNRYVLIPRPETEVLVETAAQRLRQVTPARRRCGKSGVLASLFGFEPDGHLLVADVCCGCGNIGISLARLLPGLLVIAVDVSVEALEVARQNARELGVNERVLFLQGDLFQPLEEAGLTGAFDAVTANPPYIPSETIHLLPSEVKDYEPLVALNGGPSGLSVIRRIVFDAPRFLLTGGHLFMEIGFDQAEATNRYFQEASCEYASAEVLKDYAGRQRLFVAVCR